MVKFNIKHFNTKILTMVCLFAFSSQAVYGMKDEDSKNTPTQSQQKKQTSIKMYQHTFEKVQSKNGLVQTKVSLPYPYMSIDPSKTRLFFEGEVILIDPETSKFETFVTRPLLPCLFGRIFDSGTKKSLVFHKSAIQEMKSILPFFENFSPSDTKNLEVTLYTCQLSEKEFLKHKQWYGNKTQVQEMNAVRDFLKNNLSIAEENIERRFLASSQYLKLSGLGQYEGTPITVGVTKEGVVFTTSPFTVDLYGLYDIPFPSTAKEKSIRSTLVEGQALCNMGFITRVDNLIFPMIREHFAGIKKENMNNMKYGTKPFFSTKELDVPASEIASLFKIKFSEEKEAFNLFSFDQLMLMFNVQNKTVGTNPFLNSK